ncbi:haloalkane dehalogenase [Alkalispirochaeta odontotermitis]|nr:haloalkane dehalogenase [Alkalispirochaeta odontotermitis]CAB1083874.1 Hydrolase, alpha/beta fold family protein, At1g52510/AT4G12830 homolog, group4 [Olavius algarvensis Delta 1 endosymbiont]
MKILRTPDECFSNLTDYPFDPNYEEVSDADRGSLRMHYVDEGSRDADPVLLMHGEPSWSYLYRKMIPTINRAGYRAVAPDLVGFGRSDKPSQRSDYTYQRHVDWAQAWLDALDLQHITLVCQDWGGLIGLRLVADNPNRFIRVVAANTGLPTGDTPISEAFLKWRKFSIEVPDFDVGAIIAMGCQKPLTDSVSAAYNAPFPDDSYKAGARIFPSLVPIAPDDPASPANRKAWEVLSKFEKPFLTAFSDGDPITRGGERIFQKRIPGAKVQPHTTIEGGGHFLQEDCGEELARVVVDFIRERV